MTRKAPTKEDSQEAARSGSMTPGLIAMMAAIKNVSCELGAKDAAQPFAIESLHSKDP